MNSNREMCRIPKAMVGWERRMWNALTEREVLSALELKFKSTATHDDVQLAS